MIEICVSRTSGIVNYREEHAMIREVFNSKMGPVTRDEGLHLERVVHGWNDSEEVGEDVVQVGAVQVMFAVVGCIAAPGINGRVMTLCGVWNTLFEIRARIGVEG